MAKQTKHRCPECQAALKRLQQSCHCGWVTSRGRGGLVDRQCAYSHQGQRCPCAGTISPQVFSASRWFCGDHYAHRHDAQKSQAVLQAALAEQARTTNQISHDEETVT